MPTSALTGENGPMSKIAVIILAHPESKGSLARVVNGHALLGQFDGHPSLRNLINQGYQVLTF